MNEPIIFCDTLVKIYQVADLEVIALQGLDLRVSAGEMLALVGVSGSGKSTLLNIVGGLDTPTAGTCRVAGFDLTRLSDAQRTHYRRTVVGHIWQQSGRNLLSEYSLSDNIDLPQMAGDIQRRYRQRQTRDLLRLVGLAGKEHMFPDQLSGGEQQRAGIAVALANRPAILLADEPTGELDSTTALQTLDLLRTLNRELDLTILLVTHDAAIAGETDRVIAIRDGKTSTETVRRKEPIAAAADGKVMASTVIGLSSMTHREVILVDRVGRLQLPHDIMEELNLQGKVEVRRVGDHVELWPAEEETQA
jgi:ABC-type lipoprotein export system ATPase subunit